MGKDNFVQLTKEQYNKLPPHLQSYFTYGCSHPTVKPIRLFSYLITLGSRDGDLVLDPFLGSGTTGIACKLLDRDFIGCEINKEYFEIAQKRIESIPNKLDLK